MKKISVLLLTLLLFVSCSDGDSDGSIGNNAKEIKAFIFSAADNDALEQDVAAIIDKDGKTITTLVPNGTNLTALKPNIKISDDATVSPKNKEAMDFSKEIDYTVRAENGSIQKYRVTVNVAKSSEKAITAFVFKANNNDDLNEDVVAEIDKDKNIITATVLFRTEIVELKPSITISENATISPADEIAFDFSDEVEYTVTAEDGSTQKYTVRVNMARSTAKEITSFAFKAADNDNLDIDFPGNIDEDSRNIYVELPFGTSVTALVPNIMFSENATLEPGNQEVQDFSVGVQYAITAEDGTQAVYKVTVGFTASPDREALIAIYNANPGNELFWDFNEPDLTKWAGVAIDENTGRVVALQLNAARKLSALPKEIGDLSELKELNLSNNQLRVLPDELGKLSKLETLVLSNNNLTNIPVSISQLNQLELLGLDQNEFTAFPENVLGIESLVILSLTENKIQSIPAKIQNLTELAALALSRIELKTVPPELGNLTKLRSLLLDENQLTTIPEALGKLVNLQQLYIRNNNITGIPKEICDLDIPDFRKDNKAICEK
ncbi:MAG: DUF5018 domain-containing protein [Bacteroidota bacterium]